MEITLDPNSVIDYRTFKRIKRLPVYRFRGRLAWFPDEYAADVVGQQVAIANAAYTPSPFLHDHQSAISEIAIRKEKFCVFADCGLGKTLIIAEFAKHAAEADTSKRILIVSPLMVVPQTVAECERFYGDSLQIEAIKAADLPEWTCRDGRGIGITNYEAITDKVKRGNLSGLILDESSMLKSHYGRWGTRLIELGRGLRWKLAATGTPAPNDRIEYANHAVFCDRHPTVNAFLAKYFVNKGQTQERWILKPHAVKPFYRDMSDWAMFVVNPANYGWSLDTSTIPPVHIHIEHVDLTDSQRLAVSEETGELFVTRMGGIVKRSTLSQIARGRYNGTAIDSLKPAFIRSLIESWPDEQTIVWCQYNDEQDTIAYTLGDIAASIDGKTPIAKRLQIIDDFKNGRLRVLISKPKILGFGLNLQAASRQVFSGINDSYESFYQAVKRSNRIGSTRPLNVHVPVTDIEQALIENVLRKADAVKTDAEIQEGEFINAMGTT